jgi:hypothetical protein
VRHGGAGALAALMCLVNLVFATGSAGLGGTAASANGLPAQVPVSGGASANVVLVVVDDMDDFGCAATSAYLPRSSRWLLDQGRCFENATATTPVCCPARAELQTGQVPHNNRVRRQQDAGKFDAANTIQHQLGTAGVTCRACSGSTRPRPPETSGSECRTDHLSQIT